MKIGETFSFIQKLEENINVKHTMVHYSDKQSRTWKHLKQKIQEGNTIEEEIHHGYIVTDDNIRCNFVTNHYHFENSSEEKPKTFGFSTYYYQLYPQTISMTIHKNENIKSRIYDRE
eukprot:gene5323-9133_t